MSMAAKSRQLNLDELLRLKWLLGGAMALVALWTVFFLDIEALSLVAIVSLVLLTAQIWPGLPRRVPAVVWKLAVPAIIVAMVADFWVSPDTLPVLIRLAILLVLYRGVSYRRKREDLQLLVLALFLIVVAGVLTVSLGFAFLLLAFTACALGFLFVINLIDSLETGALRTEEAATAWTRLSWRGFAGRLWRVADWRLLTFASVLFLTVVTMSGVLFTVIPRFEIASGFFLDRYITRKSRAGFSDTLRFGDVTELVQDNSVAMRVDLTDAQSVTEAPYWRLAVLDEYTADGFKVSPGLKEELLGNERRLQQVRGLSSGRRRAQVGGTWTFYIEPGVSRYLPLPGNYGLLVLRDLTAVQVSATTRIVALRVEPVTMTAFRLEDVTLASEWPDSRFAQLLRRAETEPLATKETRYDPRWTLRGPQGVQNEEVLRRVRDEITGGGKLSADEFARRAIAWLQGKHAYALSVKIPSGDGRDGIVRWLDSNEPGFCEYFAAALTVLARSAGHPARVVTGFHGGARNAFENYFMVKNSDAHAWVEIYDGVSAWRRFDPTPGSLTATVDAVAGEGAAAQDSSWSARIDSLRVLWYRRIVNFDSRQQVRMLEEVKTFTTDSGAALRTRFEEFGKKLKAWFAQPWSAARVIKLLALTLAGPWLLWSLGRVLRAAWRRGRGGRGGEIEPVRRAAGLWLGRLREHRPAAEVVDDLQRLRYGRRETWPEPRGVFRRARAARQAAKRAP